MLDARGAAVPTVIHWGADLGELSPAQLEAIAEASIPPVGPSSTDVPMRPSLVPLLADGWNGRPGLEGRHFSADGSATRMRRPSLTCSAIEPTSPASVRVHLVDAADGDAVLGVAVDIELTPQGVLRSRTTVTNLSADTYELARVATSLPLPATASEQLDFSGTWSHERRPQRAPIAQGTWLRESRHGRGGHDDAFVLAAGTPGFGFRFGEVWAFHLATSGDKALWLESTATGHTVAGLAELLAPGEVVLATGESYGSPWAMAVFSGSGLDGVAAQFHGWFRALPAHPRGPRPLTLNTWEAVYFDHDQQRLLELAEAAASVGVERFVLDDGWMTGRLNDTRALGDWTVDSLKWPDGLHPLVSHVKALGMQFGLWVEPEMVSLESTLAIEHPEWILREHTERLPLSWRNQQMLDLGNPAVRDYIVDAVSALLAEYDISYLKWDMNRDLLGGSVHAHVTGLYEVLDRLRLAYPEVEIESCSSGGARIDAGILERVQRVWPSDTNDPVERQSIERYTALLVPPEYLGSHVGAATAHTTKRTHALDLRLATALFGHAGIEWDVTTGTDAERASITAWAAQYKSLRGLIHTGAVVNADTDAHRFVRGMVSHDAREAVFYIATVGTPQTALAAPQPLPGLDAELDYVVTTAAGEFTLPGHWLTTVGVPVPLLLPDQAIVVQLDAVVSPA